MTFSYFGAYDTFLTVFHMLATIGQRIHSNCFGGISSNPLCGYSDDHPVFFLIPWPSKSSTEVTWLLNKSWLKAHVDGCLNCHVVAWRNLFQFMAIQMGIHMHLCILITWPITWLLNKSSDWRGAWMIIWIFMFWLGVDLGKILSAVS